MCGIVAILEATEPPNVLRERALDLARRLRHRGPDWSGIAAHDRAVLAHERLGIVDPESGAQPLTDPDTGRVLAVNGEIYNHRALRRGLRRPHQFRTASDCEVLLHLYDEQGPDFVDQLDGIFAFVLYDPRDGRYLVARDHIGIVPLFLGWDGRGQLYVASELKALTDVCSRIEEFPPGHLLDGREAKPRRYYRPAWRESGFGQYAPWNPDQLRQTLEGCVRRQMMSDVPFGVLISGGIDSSIIASIVAKHRERRVEDDGATGAWWPRVHSFCIGLEGAPDLEAAAQVAQHIGSVHHSYTFTVQEGLDALRDVIYHLETFDVTTIRAGTPMFLMARKIRALGIKMVLSGEGADEIFGGYLYFHKAPDAQELRAETLRKLFALNKYDCLRANKAMAAWGVEARVPFLAREMLDLVMSMDPQEKMCSNGRMEKHVLRASFEGAIPRQVLWRQKEQFSDGVGYSWIDALRHAAEERVTDGMLRQAAQRFPVTTPLTKEGYWYRSIFEELFPSPAAAGCVHSEPSIACSSATALRWDESFAGQADPSGRAVRAVHRDSY